jgi:hypothetical protein
VAGLADLTAEEASHKFGAVTVARLSHGLDIDKAVRPAQLRRLSISFDGGRSGRWAEVSNGLFTSVNYEKRKRGKS